MSTLTRTGYHRGDVWKPKAGTTQNLRVIETWYDGIESVWTDGVVLVERMGSGEQPFSVTVRQLETAFEYAGYKQDRPAWVD